MQYLTPAVVHKLQDEALASAKIRRAEEAGLLIQEFRSYRCYACFNLCSEDQYFHDECATKLIEGHALECVRNSIYRDHQCTCNINKDGHQ